MENEEYITDSLDICDAILKAIKKYEKHSSIIKITENISANEKFNVSPVTCMDMNSGNKNLTYPNLPLIISQQKF